MSTRQWQVWRCMDCGNTVETTGQMPTLRCKCGTHVWERDEEDWR